MITDEKQRPLGPSPWLSRARGQSRELAETRAHRAEQIARAFVAPRARPGLGSRPIALAAAGLVALLAVASGAWALVARTTHAPLPSAPPPSVVAPPAPPPPRAAAAPEPKPVAVARPPRRKEKPLVPPPPPPPPTGPVKFDEGDAELILVAPPPPPPPPLFSPEEFKRRR